MPRKRISIRIEHTEVTLSVTEVSTHGSDLHGSATGEPSPPKQCPSCGSPWLRNLRDVLGMLRLTAAQLKLVASEGKLHFFCYSRDEVWVCERSVQEMTGELSPLRSSAAMSSGETKK